MIQAVTFSRVERPPIRRYNRYKKATLNHMVDGPLLKESTKKLERLWLINPVVDGRVTIYLVAGLMVTILTTCHPQGRPSHFGEFRPLWSASGDVRRRRLRSWPSPFSVVVPWIVSPWMPTAACLAACRGPSPRAALRPFRHGEIAGGGRK